jgi:hypothetical protein
MDYGKDVSVLGSNSEEVIRLVERLAASVWRDKSFKREEHN